MKVAKYPFKHFNKIEPDGYGVAMGDFASPTLDHHEGFCLEFQLNGDRYDCDVEFFTIQMYDMKGRIIEVDATNLNFRNKLRLNEFFNDITFK